MNSNILFDVGQLYLAGLAKVSDPGASGTFALQGRSGGVAILTTTGNYTLPNAGFGTELYVTTDDTSVITLKNTAATTVGVFTGTSGTSGMRCKCLGVANWTTEPITASTFNAGTSNLGSLYTSATSIQAIIPISLYSLREVASGAVGNIAANGGVLASDTTPILGAINGATNATQSVTWASSNNDVVAFQTPLPNDMDFVNDLTLGAITGLYCEIASGGTTNAVGFTVDYYFSATGQKAAVTSQTNQTVTFATKTALLGNEGSDLNDNIGSKTLTVLLTPVAHTTDTLVLRSLWLNYRRKLMTS